MKILTACLVLTVFTVAFASVSVDDIVRLSRAKTNDNVILQLIEKEGIARPISSKDVVYLKEQGVSDRVIQYLVKLSSSDKPLEVGKNLRSYYTTNNEGKRIRVVTNLDENGKRMGGEVPPDPAPPEPEPVVYQPEPQEIRIVVERDSRPEEPYEPYEEEYVDDRYVMPDYPYYYPYSTPFYPGYPVYPNHGHHRKDRFPADPNQPQWNYDYSKRQPLVRPQPHRQRQQHQSSKPAHGGTGRSRRSSR